MRNELEEAVARTETETRTATCPEHGQVEATREIPRMGFPYLYFTVTRALARRRPYACPQCGAPTS